MHWCTAPKGEEMKKTLFRLAALAVALTFPTGVFAQSTSTETKTTGTQTTGTQTKKSTHKKSSKKKATPKPAAKTTPAAKM
jgi:hypothetical protein